MAATTMCIDLVAKGLSLAPDLVTGLAGLGIGVRRVVNFDPTDACGRHSPLIVDLGEGRSGPDPWDLMVLRHRRVIFSGAGSIALAVDYMKAGAVYFLDQPLCPKQLALAVAALRMDDRHDPTQVMLGLSTRQREILDGLVIGESSKAAGRRLGISPRTVECHRARVRSKLGAPNLPTLIGLVLATQAA